MLWRVIEIRGAATGLLDEPLLLSASGAGPAEELRWRGRFRDDDGRVWQASGGTAAELADAWAPAKATTGPLAALQSLRPVAIDARVEAPDGRATARTVARALLGEGARVRRWREPGPPATLCLPAGAPCATVAIDATGPSAAVATLAAALLASRGVLALVVPPPRDRTPAAEALRLATERLAAVPGATEVVTLSAREVGLPPGVAARDAGDAVTRAAAWDALLARLGARPRTLG